MLFNNKSAAVEAAIKSLEAWAISEAPLSALGICTNLDIAIDCKDIDWYFVVGCAARSWPHYSWNPVYPIPLIGYSTPEEAFEKKGLWKGAYGELRRDLCKHIASYLRDGPDTPMRLPNYGDKVWCNIGGVRYEGVVLRFSGRIRYEPRFYTTCEGGQTAIDAHTAYNGWGFIE